MSRIEQESLRFPLVVVIIRRISTSIHRVYHNPINSKPILFQKPQRHKKRVSLNPSSIHFIARQQLNLVKLRDAKLIIPQIPLRIGHLVRIELMVHVVDDVTVPSEKLHVILHGEVVRRNARHVDHALVF